MKKKKADDGMGELWLFYTLVGGNENYPRLPLALGGLGCADDGHGEKPRAVHSTQMSF